jgi:hypothetical protein
MKKGGNHDAKRKYKDEGIDVSTNNRNKWELARMGLVAENEGTCGKAKHDSRFRMSEERIPKSYQI